MGPPSFIWAKEREKTVHGHLEECLLIPSGFVFFLLYLVASGSSHPCSWTLNSIANIFRKDTPSSMMSFFYLVNFYFPY